MICPNCGAQIPEEAPNCPACGVVFTYDSQAPAEDTYQPALAQEQVFADQQPDQQPEQQPEQQPDQQPNKKSPLPIVIGVVAGLAIIGIIAYFALGMFGMGFGATSRARVVSHASQASESASDPDSGKKADYGYDRDDNGNLRTFSLDRAYNDGDEFHVKIYYTFDDDGVPQSLKVVATEDDAEDDADEVDDDSDDDAEADDADDTDDTDDAADSDTLLVNIASVKDAQGRVSELTYTTDDFDYVIVASYEYFGDTRNVKTLTYRTTERPESDLFSWNLLIFTTYLSFGDAAPLIDLASDCLSSDEDCTITFAEDGKVVSYNEYDYDSDSGEGSVVTTDLETPDKASRKSSTFTSDAFSYDSTTFTYDEAGDVQHIEFKDDDSDNVNTEDFEYATINNASPWIQTVSRLYY